MSSRVLFSTLTVLACCAATVMPALAKDGLKVALDGTFPPMASPSLSGGVEGFNVDLAKLIAERLGTTVQVDSAQFSGLIPALQAGTYDFLVAPVTVTAERAKNMLFTEGFMDADYAFLERAGGTVGKSLDDYAGKTIAVNKGSNYEAYLNKIAADKNITVVAYGTTPDAIEALMTNRADAVLVGNVVAANAVQKNPRLALGADVKTGEVWAFPFRKDDTANRDKIDAVLECLKSDGSMAKLSEKWLKLTPVAGTTVVTPTPGYGVPGFEGYSDTAHEVSCSF